MSEKTFYITTPIYYVNARPHMGHAYTTIAADALSRFHRLRGRPVFFVTGTDEHGKKNAEAAAARGLTPKQFVDELAGAFRDLWRDLHIEYDRFIRTTDADHEAVVQDVFRRLQDQGHIYHGEYEGWYCVPCETYLLESDLVDGNCPDCGRPARVLQTQCYFFRTSAFADRITELVGDNSDFVGPERGRNEVRGLLRQGLRDACISRAAQEWDLPVPGDPGETIYVWFDALVNYLTAAGFGRADERMASLWPPDVQLMGKEILPRFHGTLWPAMLMALELPLPRRIFAHGWLVTPSGGKFSKTEGNAPDPGEVTAWLAGVSGADREVCADALRYYLLREISFGQDGGFSGEGLAQRFNSDLANDLGNLLHRNLPLLRRHFDGRVPEPKGATELGGLLADAAAQVEARMGRLELRPALEEIWAVVRRANEYTDRRAPFSLCAQGRLDEAATALYDLCDCIFGVSALVSPFMPVAAQRLREQLGVGDRPFTWRDCQGGAFPPGTVIGEGAPIFPRIDRKKLGAREPAVRPQAPPSKEAAATVSASEMITFREFEKLDLRVAQVLSAAKVEGADKLLKLEVDLGDERRTLVAGIAQQFTPEEMVGKKVVVVANLEPATIRGVESRGMILAATEGRTPLALVVPDRDCPVGSRVR
jgi:methionyl-tRNA synthetase